MVQRLKGVDVGEGLDVGNSNSDLNEDSNSKDDDSDYGEGDTASGDEVELVFET